MALVTMPDASWVTDIGDDARASRWSRGTSTNPDPRADEVAVVVPPYLDPHQRLDLLGTLPRLELVQLLTAGYDNVTPHVPRGVTLCSGGGIHDASTAELALTLILASIRGDSRLRPGAGPAPLDPDPDLAGAGRPAGARRGLRQGRPGDRRAAAAVRDAPSPRSPAGPATATTWSTTVHGIDELPALLPEQDVVVVITPLTDATAGLVDARFLAAMKDGALLVNVARGKVADTDALLAEAASGRLRVAVDVTDPEPLPADHPLWIDAERARLAARRRRQHGLPAARPGPRPTPARGLRRGPSARERRLTLTGSLSRSTRRSSRPAREPRGTAPSSIPWEASQASSA